VNGLQPCRFRVQPGLSSGSTRIGNCTSGNGRIRTCVGPFGPSRLAGGCHQPLGHVSICSSAGSRTQIFAFKERRAAITPRRIKLLTQASNLEAPGSEPGGSANSPSEQCCTASHAEESNLVPRRAPVYSRPDASTRPRGGWGDRRELNPRRQGHILTCCRYTTTSAPPPGLEPGSTG
jgi:hypothetical protein